jgi:hypothetical protein
MAGTKREIVSLKITPDNLKLKKFPWHNVKGTIYLQNITHNPNSTDCSVRKLVKAIWKLRIIQYNMAFNGTWHQGFS